MIGWEKDNNKLTDEDATVKSAVANSNRRRKTEAVRRLTEEGGDHANLLASPYPAIFGCKERHGRKRLATKAFNMGGES